MRHINKTLFLILIALTLLSCDRFSPVDPIVSSGISKSIMLNQSDYHSEGLDSLILNEGQVMNLNIKSLIQNLDAEYTWESKDPSILDLQINNNSDTLAVATAKGTKGATTTLVITDTKNNIVKNIPVKIEKYWADSKIFEKIGELNGHHYYISKNKFNWLKAREVCSMFGAQGHLVTFSQLDENVLIHKNITEPVWIGMTFLYGNDPLKKWITDEEITFENWFNSQNPSLPGYKPSVGMQYYFIYMKPNGFWANDVVQTKKFILEFDKY